MRCPKCGAQEDKVIDSRAWKDGAVIRRRRECMACQHRFTTYEEIEHAELRVIKRDGRYESFDRKKIISGMLRACEKRPVSIENIEHAVAKMTYDLEQEFDREIPTTVIGEKIMMTLKKLDEVAYVRFASVYRQFRDIDDFVHAVQNLKT
jgi:transcriptional repressor NrdR